MCDIDAERARSFLQWRSEIRFSEPSGARPAFTTGVRANIRLPGLNRRLNRLRLVIQGETRDAVATLFPRTPGEPVPEDETAGTAESGLRFLLLDLLSKCDVLLENLRPGESAYAAFLDAYREAARSLRSGVLDAVFPAGSFPPALPFRTG